YWMVLPPMLAAIRLLATRLPPDNVPFPTAMATLEQTGARPHALPSPPMPKEIRARALKTVAFLAAGAAAVAYLWLDVHHQWFFQYAATAVEFGAIFVVIQLWRRGQRFAAVDANEELKYDPRAPILFLRSFQDDSSELSEEGGALWHRFWRLLS